MRNLNTISTNSGRNSGGCLSVAKKNPVRCRSSTSLCLKPGIKVSCYGKKLAAILQKSDYTFEEPACVTCLRDVVQRARSTQDCCTKEECTAENVRVKQLACALQKLITQSKSNDNCDGKPTFTKCFKTMPPKACVQKKYEHLTHCIDSLVERELQSKCSFLKTLNEVCCKKIKLKKKRSKTNKLVKIHGDCICKSAFCRRKSYAPKWDSSISPKLDTIKYCKNKCCQSGKHMTTSEMLKWNEKIKRRKCSRTKSSTLLNKKASAAKVKSNKNDKCKKTIGTQKTHNNKDVSTNICRCVNRQIQCEKVSVDDIEKPSLISVCIQCSEILKKTASKTTNCSEQKLRRHKRNQTPLNSSNRDRYQSIYSAKKSTQKSQRSRSVKRSEQQEDGCVCSTAEKATKNVNPVDEEDMCGLRKGLFQILEKLMKRRRKRMQDK